MPPKRRAELLEMVEREYRVNHQLLSTAANTVAASRSLGFTLIAALTGFGVTQHSWPLAAVGGGLGLVAYLVDGYYSWRSEGVESYIRRLETILATSYRATHKRPRNAVELVRLDRRLRALRVGSLSQLHSFGWGDIWHGKPRAIFQLLYPVLIGAIAVITLVIGLTSGNKEAPRPVKINVVSPATHTSQGLAGSANQTGRVGPNR
jgi:hypothetical protein